MPFRFRAFLFSILLGLGLFPLSGGAAELVDAAGRHVVLPARVERILAANEAAAVFVLALAPKRLVGWPQRLSAAALAYLPAKYAALPVTGRLTGAAPTASAETVARFHPDLIIDWGRPTPAERARVDRIAIETRVPTLLLDPGFQNMPSQLRHVGRAIGAAKRSRDLAERAADIINGLRGTLLTRSPTKPPRVYFGLGRDGLSTAGSGSETAAAIAEAGAIDLAARGGRRQMTRAELLHSNPSIVIAQKRSFYNALRRDPDYRNLKAVREHHVYLAPALPFGWLDRPDGINRLIGLDWLSAIFYPQKYSLDFSTKVRRFYQKFYGMKPSDKALAALLRGAGVRAAAPMVSNAAGAPLFGPPPNFAPTLPPNLK